VAGSTRAVHCDVNFGEGLALSDAGEVALEDYARVLTAAIRAEALRGDPTDVRITAVRLVGGPNAPSTAQHRDIEDFARGLAAQSGGLGLGWA
jgi:hypothetical protein